MHDDAKDRKSNRPAAAQASQQSERLRSLARLSRAMSSDPEAASALWQLVSAVRRDLVIDRVGVFHFDPESSRMDRVAGVSVDGRPEFEGQSLEVTDERTPLNHVARRMLPYYLSDDAPADYPDHTFAPGVKAHAVIPIIAGGDVLGALCADNCFSGKPLPESLLEPLFLYAQLAVLPLFLLYQKRERERQELARRRLYREVLAVATNGKIILCEQDEIEGEWPLLDEQIVIARDVDIRAVRDAIRQASLEAGMQRERAEDFALCASEAATNALLHGQGGCAAVGWRDHTVRIRIIDTGHGIDPADLPRATLMKGWSSANSLGLGFTIINEIADRIYLYTGPGGTNLIVEMSVEPQEHLPASCAGLGWHA